MKYTEESIKSFFEYMTSPNFVSQYTYGELYRFTKNYFDHVGFFGISKEHKELWDKMDFDMEKYGYLRFDP